MNKDMPQDLRTRTLALVTNNAADTQSGAASAQVSALISAWLGALDDEDLAGVAPESLAAILQDGFAQVSQRTVQGCQIARMRYTDGR